MYEVAKPLKIEAAKVAEIPEAAENYFLFKECFYVTNLNFLCHLMVRPLIFQT